TRNNLHRIEAQHPGVTRSSQTVRWVHRYIPGRLALLVGPSTLISKDGTSALGLSMGLRYRVSADSRRLPWFLDLRGTTPFGDSKVANQSESFDSQGLDRASLSFKYQASLGLLGELPHGE